MLSFSGGAQRSIVDLVHRQALRDNPGRLTTLFSVPAASVELVSLDAVAFALMYLLTVRR